MKIEKGIPIPEGHFKEKKYPFFKMEVGDSFSVELSKAASLRNLLQQYKNKNPSKSFITRTVDNNMIRCWRTK
jgi:hypothetical protein